MSGVEEASHGARAVIPHNPIFEQLVKRKTIAGNETREIPYILETGIFRYGSLPAIRLPTPEELVARIRIQFPNQEGALVKTGHCAHPASVWGLRQPPPRVQVPTIILAEINVPSYLS